MDGLESSGAKNKLVNIVVIIIACVVAAYIYQGQMKSIKVAQEKKATEEKKNVVLQKIDALQLEVGAVKKMLVKQETSVIMGTVSSFAQEAGVRILSFRPGSEQRQQDYVKTGYYIELTAPDYHALSRFINKLESNRDIFIMQSITMRPALNSSGRKESLTVTVIFDTVSAIN
jgi:Tfp pilus assembly protein PilO